MSAMRARVRRPLAPLLVERPARQNVRAGRAGLAPVVEVGRDLVGRECTARRSSAERCRRRGIPTRLPPGRRLRFEARRPGPQRAGMLPAGHQAAIDPDLLEGAVESRDDVMPAVGAHRAGRIVGEGLQSLRVDLHGELTGRGPEQALLDVTAAIAEVEADRTVLVHEQAEAAMARCVELANDGLPPDRSPTSDPDLERAARPGASRPPAAPPRSGYKPGWIGWTAGGIGPDEYRTWSRRWAVNVGAEPADLELIGMRAADVEADHFPGGDADAIGVGVDPLDGSCLVGRDGCGRRARRVGRNAVRHPIGDHERRGGQGTAGRGQEFASVRVGHVRDLSTCEGIASGFQIPDSRNTTHCNVWVGIHQEAVVENRWW